MKFEMDPKIEEMLNSYLDGELSAEDCAHVRRLVGEDKGIANRLRELERCRLLVSSLPPSEPPAEVVSGIKQMLHSRLAAGTGAANYAHQQQQGLRHLLVRQVLAASVIIGLAGLLGAVIYRIMVPGDSTPAPVAVRSWPVGIVAPEASSVETEEAVAGDDTGVGLYSLRLTTSDLVAVDAFVNKLLDESTWLKYDVTKEPSKRSIYRVLCSRGGLEALVSDLTPAWSKFDTATLVMQGGNIAGFVTVRQVRPEQITDIVKQDTANRRIKMAKDFAVLNNIRRLMPAERMTAFAENTNPELTAIPKPVLTSGEKTPPDVPKGANDEVRVDLTIVVSAHK